MTTAYTKPNQKTKRLIRKLLISISVLTLFFLTITLSKEISTYVLDGLRLALKVIIPSVFPFLLITDLFTNNISVEKISPIRKAFEKLFGISGYAASTFLCGVLCGFPIGAKMSIELYKNGIISKYECERLMSFCNNASPAYVIFVIGMTLRSSLYQGMALYLLMIFSAFFTGVILGTSKQKNIYKVFIYEQKYSFVSSVQRSTEICISICGFITTFAIICGLIKRVIKNKLLCGILISFFEIGNASLFLSDLCIFRPCISFALTSFCISFSGISVIAQTQSILGNTHEISIFNHIKYKFLQGCISFISALIVFKIIFV